MGLNNYLELKEKVSHGDFQLPMDIYTGEFLNNFNIYLHWHDEMEFIYIKSGIGKLYLDLNFYPVEEGDFIIVKKGTVHYVVGDRTSLLKYEAMVFDLDMLQNSFLDFSQLYFIDVLMKNELYITPIIKKNETGYVNILDYFNKITNSFFKKDFGFQLQIKGYFFLLFFEIFNKGYAKKSSKNPIIQNTKLHKIKEVISFIQSHYNEHISVKTLADVAEYSEYHFIRFFKVQTGKTCTEFVNLVRIEKATTLLITTELSITEIAYEVGFSDVSYFIKIFNKNFSLSPNSYRRKVHHKS